MNTTYHLNYLEQLEAESIHIFREVAAQFEKPALLFSGAGFSNWAATSRKI